MKRLLLAAVLSILGFGCLAATLPLGPGSVFPIGPSAFRTAIFTPTCAQSTAFLDRTGGFSTQQKYNYDTAICSLVAAGTFAKLDALYALPAPTQAVSLLNLVSTSYALTVTPTMTFGANAGYTGNASTGYLNTNFTPSSAGGHCAVGSCSFGAYITNTRQALQSFAAMGVLDTTFSFALNLSIMATGNPASANNACEIGSGANATDSTVSNTQGLWLCNQTGGSSGTESLYHNTTDLNDKTATNPTLPNAPVLIGGFNVSGVPSVVDFSGDTYAFAFIGSGLTTGDIAALNTAFSNFPIVPYPPVAANWGFTNSELAYNFATQGLAGIDINNTLQPGYIFYPSIWFGFNTATAPSNFAWTAGQYVSVTNGRIGTIGDTTAAYQGSIAANVLTVSSVLYGNLKVGQIIAGQTCVSGAPTIASFGTGSGGIGTYNLSAGASSCAANSKLLANSFVGTTIPAGGYFEAKVYLGPSCGSAGAFPSFWMQALQGMYSANFNAGYGEASEWQENDIGEFAAQNDANILDTTNTNGSGSIGTSNEVGQHASWPTDGNLHKVGLLWVPAAKNGGTGLYQFFLDGVNMAAISGPSNVSYTTTTGSTPASTPSNPNGVLSVGDGQTFDVLFDAFVTNSSGNCAFKIAQVNVWH